MTNTNTTDTIAFESLSAARRRKLAREARIFCNQHPYLADAANYWRTLSARYVAALGFEVSR